ncbi:nucleoside/nucleotide kinase family protein [Salinisphaera hydrothermalis]|uniref:nucleoside/nucleotide kinase family protein n=1 Tax=Salinisphaera hydrothermalis TaxID=563188 RepID=UPI00334037C7
MSRDTIDDRITLDPAVLEAVQALAGGPKRRLLGIVGAPAAGKSTLALALARALGERASSVPMDGFHLSQHQLDILGRADRKGAPDTFDADGYRALLGRIRAAAERNEIVYAPGFYREIEEPIAASLAVAPETPLVITEGNYLLLDDAPWPDVAAQLDAVWYLDVDTPLREEWLVARHMRFGRGEAEARAWMVATDRPNAERIVASAHRADRVLRWDGTRIEFAAP